MENEDHCISLYSTDRSHYLNNVRLGGELHKQAAHSSLIGPQTEFVNHTFQHCGLAAADNMKVSEVTRRQL